MTKKSKNSKLLVHYTRTMTPENLSRAANYVGGYVLKGLGALGKIFTAPLTGGPLGPATVVLPKTKKLLDAERKLKETQEELIGKAMTWVSPLNYGAALATGNGFNARKGEEEVASWSPAWLATARLVELGVGPKAVKGVKSAPRVVINTAAKAGVKPAKTAVVAREINKVANKGILTLKQLQPKVRTRYGDVEIDNPLLAYRLGTGIVKDFLKTGKVRAPKLEGYGDEIVSTKFGSMNFGKDFKNPMFAQGKLFFGLPRKADRDLLVTSEPLALAVKSSSKVPSSVNGTIDVKYAGFNNGRIRSRRVLDYEGQLNPENTTAYRWVPGYGYKKVIQEPSTSLRFFERPTLSNTQELAGATKWERNFKPKWHVANYPGYLLKGLMKGSLLEKQLSKNGTININQLNAYFNKASQIEKDVASKVLNEQFAGLKVIDYNLFKKAILNELINYSTKPQMRYSTYGMGRLGFNVIKESDGAGGIVEYLPGIRTNTFTFESPKLSVGSNKHYDTTTLGHSRTYTTPDEPKVLHVMESLSDWGLSKVKMLPSVLTMLIAINKAIQSGNTNAFHGFTNKLHSLLRNNLNKYEQIALDNINKEIESGQPSGFLTIEDLWNKKYEILKKAGNRSNIGVLGLHLHDNYLQRQLLENLKYASEHGQTKMRYPTSETAAKIEGYLKTINPKYLELLDKLSELHMKLNELLNQEALHKMFNEPFSIKDNLEETYKVREELKSILDEILQVRKNGIEKTYIPEHQTILKKYTDFPKLFLKLFKDLKVRIVADTKGNTWYEVDVPKGYLSREWQFKQGGKMNILEFLKNGSGIHIKEKNKGSFTRWCGGNVTDECILRGKNSSNPKIRKKATFAANARKWKHKEGGVLKAQFGLPLNLSSEDIKGGFNFIKQGLGKIWDIVNTPIIDTSGVSVQLPNGNLLNIPGTLGGAPEILPGRMDKGVLLIEKHAPNFFKLINEFPTLAKNLVLGNVKLFKEFFRTGNKDLLKLFETKSDFMLNTSNSKSAIPKGFTKGNEVAPKSGTQPISETGLNIRETRLGNMNNSPRNPSEKLAVEDWNTMNPDNKISTLLPTGRPSYKIELDGLKIDIRYPKLTTSSAKKIKTDYTQSGTALERAVEGKRYGISRKGRVSSNDRNARAMESGDARTTNAGYTNVKKGLILQVEKNLDKYPKFEIENHNKLLLRLYRKNRSEAEINKVKREFYKYLAKKYGYFKIGGVIKANTGTKFNWNSALNTGVNLMGQFLPSIIGDSNNNYSDIMANTALLYMLNQQLENEVLSNYDKIMSKLHFDPSNPNANGGSIVKNHVNYLALAPVIAGLKEFNDNYKKFLDGQVKNQKTNYITNALTNTLLTGFDLALNYKPTTKKRLFSFLRSL